MNVREIIKVGTGCGLDNRLLAEKNIAAIERIKLEKIHFAWDYMKERNAVLPVPTFPYKINPWFYY